MNKNVSADRYEALASIANTFPFCISAQNLQPGGIWTCAHLSVFRFPTEYGRTDPLFRILGGIYPSTKSKWRKWSFIVKGHFQHNICLGFLWRSGEHTAQPPSLHALVRNQWDNFNAQCHLFCSPNEASFISIRHTLSGPDSFLSLHLDRNAVGILIGVWPYTDSFSRQI